MSYARWGNDSSVYVFESCSGGLECCGCFLSGVSGPSPRFATSGEMIAHLNEHRAAGDLVPEYCIEQILEDHPDQTATIQGEPK